MNRLKNQVSAINGKYEDKLKSLPPIEEGLFIKNIFLIEVQDL
jgi:hypothetical protein